MARDYSLTGAESRTAVEAGLAEAEWYRSPIPRDKMRELVIRKDFPAVRDTLLWFGLIAGSGYLVFMLWGNWYVIFPYMVYSVLYASTSDSRWHESSHGTAFRSDWMNNLLYEISSFMVFRQSTVWRWSHIRHHSDTIIRGRDPEIAVPRPPSIRRMLLAFVGLSGAIPEFRRMVTHFFGRIDSQAAEYVPEEEYGKVFLKARIYILIYISVIALSIYLKTFLPVMYVGLPTLLGSWLMPVYGLTQHSGLQENVLDHRLNCRTVYMNRIHRWLYWNMNYHVEHHMFPLVPYHALPRLHSLMKDDCPVPYKGIIAAWKEIIPAVLRQRKDPSYFVERELPVSVIHPGQVPEKGSDPAEALLENGMIRVCSEGDLRKEEIVRFDFDSRSYAVCRTADDRLFTVDGFCTHAGAHLADGVLISNMIECPKHNGRFSLTNGSPCRAPAGTAIGTYETLVENGYVYMKLPQDNGRGDGYLSYQVIRNTSMTPFIKELVIAPVGEGISGYKPGQYLKFVIPPYKLGPEAFMTEKKIQFQVGDKNLKELTAENKVYAERSYSMASTPSETPELVFNIKLDLHAENGRFVMGLGSAWLFSLKPGDQLTVTGPFGAFVPEEAENELVFIGGGSGMAPLRAHIEYLFERKHTRRKTSYWYGARSLSDLYYIDYFNKITGLHDNFSFHAALSEALPGDDWQGLRGYVHEVARDNYLGDHKNLNDIDFYLCGPPVMIRAAIKMLKGLGVEDSRIRYDEF
jgi:fatty acid desaturase/NAD(P)H-flavin reductase/nitrite reductase/ring-hydroxylating ferredoxin subunit